MSSCFQCSKEGMEYLRSQDAKLAGVMDAVGEIHREMDPDLFGASDYFSADFHQGAAFHLEKNAGKAWTHYP